MRTTGRADRDSARRRARRTALAFAGAGLLALAGGAAAVAINPIALYIDGRTRSGVLTLYNDGTRPEEVQISFAFGYPRSDSSGHVAVELSDTAAAGEPSAVPWVSAFPRRVVLQPGERQAVRILVEPPAGTAEGEYWARVLVKSRGGQPPIEQQREDGVRVQVEVETIIAVPLSYRHGEVSTGAAVRSAAASLAADSVTATIDLQRTGNAAYLGQLRAEVLDGRGRVIGMHEEYVGVYRDLRRVLRIPVRAAAGEPLRVRFSIEAERDDLPSEGPLPAPAVVHTVEVMQP